MAEGYLEADAAQSERPDGLRDVELPSGFGRVQVRSLRKATMSRLRDKSGVIVDGEINLGAFEPEVFREGLVQPELTAEQVATVFENWPAGDVDAVLEAILDSSGLGADFRDARADLNGAAG
jgi:hypothetical protein